MGAELVGHVDREGGAVHPYGGVRSVLGADPSVVSIGWDGQSNPMYRYREDLPLPDHQRRIVAPEHRPDHQEEP